MTKLASGNDTWLRSEFDQKTPDRTMVVWLLTVTSGIKKPATIMVSNV